MILYINACVRKKSRTDELSKTLLGKLGDYEEVKLSETELSDLLEEGIKKRDADSERGCFDDPCYDHAKKFKEADIIVMASPFWDMSFTAALKRYIENIMVSGITFTYSEDGSPVGLCKAEKLYYITTAGGPIYDYDFGYGYIKSLAEGMLGIKECVCYSAEGLDIFGNDPEKILDEAKKKIADDF